MKKLVIILITVLATQWVMAQGTVSQVYIGRTSVGPKVGFSVDQPNKNNFKYGGFFQKSSLPYLWVTPYILCPILARKQVVIGNDLRIRSFRPTYLASISIVP